MYVSDHSERGPQPPSPYAPGRRLVHAQLKVKWDEATRHKFPKDQYEKLIKGRLASIMLGRIIATRKHSSIMPA